MTRATDFGGGLFLGTAVAVTLATLSAQTPRAEAIKANAKAIEQECQRAAGGDWQAWVNQLAPFRKGMLAQIEQALKNPRTSSQRTVSYGVLQAKGVPPLFDVTQSVGYLSPPELADYRTWLKERTSIPAIVAVKNWLKNRGIDLIFVPVPKMIEVYPERVAENVPPSRIVAPHVRKMILDLLSQDVEVIDLLPAFLEARREDSAPLYLPADPHWSDRGQRIAAGEIVRRLRRYLFAKQTLAKPSLYVTEEKTAFFRGAAWDLLTEAEHEAIGDAVNTPVQIVKKKTNGESFVPVDDCPIMIIGDSYTDYTRASFASGSGIAAQVSKGINQPVTVLTVQGGNLQPIKELLRDQDLLSQTQAIVWIVENVGFTNSWPALPVLPPVHRVANAH
jgi:hypothetical protein